jgi:hypothetical protein
MSSDIVSMLPPPHTSLRSSNLFLDERTFDLRKRVREGGGEHQTEDQDPSASSRRRDQTWWSNWFVLLSDASGASAVTVLAHRRSHYPRRVSPTRVRDEGGDWCQHEGRSWRPGSETRWRSHTGQGSSLQTRRSGQGTHRLCTVWTGHQQGRRGKRGGPVEQNLTI